MIPETEDQRAHDGDLFIELLSREVRQLRNLLAQANSHDKRNQKHLRELADEVKSLRAQVANLRVTLRANSPGVTHEQAMEMFRQAEQEKPADSSFEGVGT